MTETEKPSYYSILPANIRYDNRLTANAKLLYCEITSLANAKGFAFAHNDYFASLFGVSDKSISRWLKQLEDLGYIKIEYILNDLSQRKIFIETKKENNVFNETIRNIFEKMFR